MAETVRTSSLIIDPENRENREHITPSLKNLDDLEQRLTKNLDDVEQRLTKNLDDVEQRLTKKLDEHDKRFDSIDKKLDSLLNAAILHV